MLRFLWVAVAVALSVGWLGCGGSTPETDDASGQEAANTAAVGGAAVAPESDGDPALKSESSGASPEDERAGGADERAVLDVCRRIRDAAVRGDFSDSARTIWLDRYVLFAPSPDGSQAHVATWDEVSHHWRSFLDSIDEIVPCTDAPSCCVEGPIGMVQWKVLRCRTGQAWQTFQGLKVAARRFGAWRIVAEIAGDWMLSREDRFDAARDEHRELQRLCDQVNRVYTEKNLDLLEEIYHSRCRGIGYDPANPASALVMDNEQCTAVVRPLLSDETFQKGQVQIRYVKIQGPVAVALREDDSGVRCLTVFARTGERWWIALNVQGDWDKLLLSLPKPTETGADS